MVTHHGAIAQLVEQWTENPCVAGSIPARTTRPSTQVAPARETMIDVGCRLSDCEGSNVKEGGDCDILTETRIESRIRFKITNFERWPNW